MLFIYMFYDCIDAGNKLVEVIFFDFCYENLIINWEFNFIVYVLLRGGLLVVVLVVCWLGCLLSVVVVKKIILLFNLELVLGVVIVDGCLVWLKYKLGSL